jgi:hypothetical protein
LSAVLLKIINIGDFIDRIFFQSKFCGRQPVGLNQMVNLSFHFSARQASEINNSEMLKIVLWGFQVSAGLVIP